METTVFDFTRTMVIVVAAVALAKLLLLWQPWEPGKKLGGFI